MAVQWWQTGDGKMDDGHRDRSRLLRALAHQALSGSQPLDVSDRPASAVDQLISSETLRELGGIASRSAMTFSANGVSPTCSPESLARSSTSRWIVQPPRLSLGALSFARALRSSAAATARNGRPYSTG
jgi:hypothetical protein